MANKNKNKKRKISGLGGLELLLAYNSLLRLKESITDHESGETLADTNEPLEDLGEQVGSLIELMQSRLEGPNSFSFSSITDDHLTKWNITGGDLLILKPNLTERIQYTTTLGQNELWSSNNLYRHLNVLDKVVSRKESSARAWIDAFFFRASAMQPSDMRMILHMEHKVPGITVNERKESLSGLIDYAAIVAEDRMAGFYLHDSNFQILKKRTPSGFFVIEAKYNVFLDDVPQAVGEMYACGRHIKKKIIRGALTNGRDWIFLFLKFDDDYNGASYKQSDVISFGLHSPRQWIDLISAILSYWIENSL